MTVEKKGFQIKEAFDLAQKPHQNLAKLVTGLRTTYDQVSVREGLTLGLSLSSLHICVTL